MTGIDADDIAPRPQDAAPRPKGKLPWLPERGAPLSEHRQWLTRAFAPPDGYHFDVFERHGRRLSDAAYIAFSTPAGSTVRYRFPEQRALAKPTNLRSSVVSISDGLLRMPPLGPAEASDVWVELCSIATIAEGQDEVEEFREQLDAFLRIAEPETRYTLEMVGRFEALQALQGRGVFERPHAQQMAVEVDEAKWKRRPVLLVDARNASRWVRVAELATYFRVVLGQPQGHGALDSAMSEIGATRLRYEVRIGREHPHANLYRLPHPDGNHS